MISVLTIAGSDSSGGAGIQGDLRTFMSLGLHGATVITALTAQNTTEVLHVEPSESVKEQINALDKDLDIKGVKIGMVYGEDTVKYITEYVKKQTLPIVLDPLMISTTGRRLCPEKTVDTMTKTLFPFVSLITPNLQEAMTLGSMDDIDEKNMVEAAKQLSDRFNTAVLLKGGHLSGETLIDVLVCEKGIFKYSHPFIKNRHSHGTGCCLSSAITGFMAIGKSMPEAVANGIGLVQEAINYGYSIGKGDGPVDPILHRIKSIITDKISDSYLPEINHIKEVGI